MNESENLTRRSANEVLAEIIQKNTLPTEVDFLACLYNENGVFTKSEGVLHDYKDEFPHSNSDEHFAGILRLICAFHNTYGGCIIFGVHDKSRLGGKNKVDIDQEKINRRLRESFSQFIQISHRKYKMPSGQVDVLLVPKREIGIPPVRFSNDIRP